MVYNAYMNDSEKFIADLRVQMEELRGDVKAILVEVKATNGRVTKGEMKAEAQEKRIESIENFKQESMAMVRGAVWIITTVVSVGGVLWAVAQAAMSVLHRTK